MPPSDVVDLVERALPGRHVRATRRIGEAFGVFSVVHRVELDGDDEPASVVVKQPDPGPNGSAAAAAGAYRREALAYGTVLPITPVAAPACHLVASDEPDRASFVLEDLTGRRSVDQLDGMAAGDAAAVANQLAALHRRWEDGAADLQRLAVRRWTPAGFDPNALATGVREVDERWAAAAGDGAARTLGRLLARRAELVEAFASAGPPTLCHGDPRADNLVFDDDGGARLFDWQQLAINPAQADLAWLAATSLEPEVRRRIERDLVARHASGVGHDPALAWDRYRAGMVLPGLAVLLLAQRWLGSARGEQMVATSLRRIATAVDDLDVADLGR